MRLISSTLKSQEQLEEGLRREVGRTARLGFPLALGELGWMSTYIVDAIMIGRLPHSALAISASSLGNTIYYAIVFCVIRGMDGVEALVAQSWGRQNRTAGEDCLRTLGQSMWFVILGTPLVMALTAGSMPVLRYFNTPTDIVAETARYLNALVWSTAPLLFYMAVRRYLQSINRVALVTISLITATVVNLAGDWALLYGHLGAHAMGIAGSGWATCIVRFYMAALLVGGLIYSLRRQALLLEWKLLRPDFARLRLLIRIGWPSAVQNLTDLGFSTWMSVVCAQLGATLLAAHQVVLDLDAFVYMVPAGLSYATVTRVGQSAGLGSLPAVGRSAKASLILAVSFISIASILFAGLPHVWASVYTNDPAVIAASAPIFLICGLLQLGDAVNVIYCSALTGLGDTRTPFLVNTAIYWIVGAPVAWLLAFHSSLALRGLWLGRGLAAILTGITMAAIWNVRLKNLRDGSTLPLLSVLEPLSSK